MTRAAVVLNELACGIGKRIGGPPSSRRHANFVRLCPQEVEKQRKRVANEEE
jgi:hypothetical protein